MLVNEINFITKKHINLTKEYSKRNQNFFLWIFMTIAFLLNIDLSNSKLIGVIQINRHGARTGKGFEKLTSKLYFGSNSKQLTINGISQHEILGHYIADKYMHNEDEDYNILDKDYSENEFIIYSSSKQRAIFSGFGFIKGIYPYSKFRFNFLNKGKNSTYPIPKNYSNLQSSDLISDVTIPVYNYKPKRSIPEITLNILEEDFDTIFKVKGCKIQIGEDENNNPVYSNLTLKELIKLDSKRFNYTEPLNFTIDEMKNAVEEIIKKFPIALLEGLLNTENIEEVNKLIKLKTKENNQNIEKSNRYTEIGNDEENNIQEEISEIPVSDRYSFLRKVNAFIRFAQFHFGENFLIASPELQRTMNKIQVNKSYNSHLTTSNYKKLVYSRIFNEIKNHLLSFLKNHLQNKDKTLKYVVYSGHDHNIIGVLANFFDRKFLLEKILDFEKSYDFVQPELASHILIELHSTKNFDDYLNSDNSDAFIRLNYNGLYLKEGLNNEFFTYNMNLDGFELKSFLRILDSLIDLNYKNLNCQKINKDA